MTEAGNPLTRFDIGSGELRGTQLALHAGCLVHRGASHLETLPLATIAAVRVEFDRDARRIGWGVACVIIALVLFAVSGPLGSLAGAAAHEVAAQQAFLLAFFRLVEGTARALPFIATATALGGALLCGLGWVGTTTLTVSFAGGERAYPVRGRNSPLLDFAERLSEQVMAVKR